MIAIKSSPEPYHASKWLSIALLVDKEEMKALFHTLGNFVIFPVGRVVDRDTEVISHETFLNGYGSYIDSLTQGKIPDELLYKPLFSSVFSMSSDHLYAIFVGDKGKIIRVAKPVIQLQAHNLSYSKADERFRSMAFGRESVLWGIQFSYPQLFEDPQTHFIHKVDQSFPNTSLFRNLLKWSRENTIPTPFIVDNKTVNVPMRLGRKCLPWINHHPQLLVKGITVNVS